MKLILASQSVDRKRLLEKLGIPFTTSPADIDESELKHESPRAYVIRIARAKAEKVAAENPGCVVLAADTPLVVGRRILQKAESKAEAVAMIKRQSGRRVHIPTVVAVANAEGKISHTYVESWIKFKRITDAEIEAYLARVPRYKHLAGALSVEDADAWIQTIHGSHSGIIGLPLYETTLLLKKAGITVPPQS